MTCKSVHLEYISHRGVFHLDCDPIVFTKGEIVIIEKWGHWFRGLTSGELHPFTQAQERFIKVMKVEMKPVTPEEKAWFKYLRNKINKVRSGENFTESHEPMRNKLYSRRVRKKMNKINVGAIAWSNRRGMSEK